MDSQKLGVPSPSKRRERHRSSTMSSRSSTGSGAVEPYLPHMQLGGGRGRTTDDVEPLSNLAVPIPAPEEFRSPGFSAVGSRRNLRRHESMRSTRSEVKSDMDEGIGEALDALSRTLSRKGSFFSNVSKQSFNQHQNQAGATRLGMGTTNKAQQSSMAAREGADRSTPSLAGLNVSIPIVHEDPSEGPSPTGLGDRSHSLMSESMSSAAPEDGAGGGEDAEEELPDDVDELKDIVRWRTEQLQEAVGMGQKVFVDLREAKEELNLVLEEQALLEEENELAKKENQEYAARVRTLSRQLADARQTIAEMDQRLCQQEDDMKDLEAAMDEEKRKHEEHEEELREEQRWQEEKFVTVQEAAKRKEKGNVHVMAMKAVQAHALVRRRYFMKLRLFFIENKKKRQCFHYLHFNLKQECRNREDITCLFFQRWCSRAKLGLSIKQQQRDAFEAAEAAARAQIEHDTQARLIMEMNATIALSVFAWQVAVEEGGYIQDDLESEIKLVRATTDCVISECTWRQKLWTQAMQSVCTTLQSGMNCATNEWLATHSASALRSTELSRIRDQWHAETKELRDQLSVRDSATQALSTKLKEVETRYAASQSTVELQELAIGELRQEKARSNVDMIALQEQFEHTEAELARAKSHLEFQHTRAKTRVQSMCGDAAITPCLKQAMALVASLRARTEATRQLSDPTHNVRAGSPPVSVASPS